MKSPRTCKVRCTINSAPPNWKLFFTQFQTTNQDLQITIRWPTKLETGAHPHNKIKIFHVYSCNWVRAVVRYRNRRLVGATKGSFYFKGEGVMKFPHSIFFCRMIWSSIATIGYVLSRNIIHMGPKKGLTSYGGAARSKPSMWLHAFSTKLPVSTSAWVRTIRKTNAANENNVGWWRGEDRLRYVWKRGYVSMWVGT